MSAKPLVIFLVFALIVIIFSPTPAVADEFEYLGEIESSHGLYYGWMARSGSYIGVGDGSDPGYGIEIIDVSNPSDMQSAGFRAVNHMTYSLDWEGDYLYVPGEFEGFFIYDVSNFENIVQASVLDNWANPVAGVSVRGDIAYIGTDWNGGSGGLYCVDVANPYNPSVVWGSDTLDCFEIFLGTNLLYSYSWCQDIRIVDILNPTHPRQVTRISCPLIDAMDIDESRNLMYVTCFDYGLLIYDISNPLQPSLLSSTQMPNNTQCIDVCHSKVCHEVVFVSGYTGGLWAMDTSDPAAPEAVASYFPEGDRWCGFVRSRDNLVYLTAGYSLIALRYDCQVAVDDPVSGLAGDFSLGQNYPNPFNAGTRISFMLPRSQNIKLEICDAIGRMVVTLFDGYQAAGRQAFYWDGSEYASGRYFYRLSADDLSLSRQMILIK
jgi:hypothetical protein